MYLFFNEEDNIFQINEEINNITAKYSLEHKRNFEIIYVDDGSEDNTFEELKKTKNNKSAKQKLLDIIKTIHNHQQF